MVLWILNVLSDKHECGSRGYPLGKQEYVFVNLVIYKILNIGVLNSISQMHLQNICHSEICHIYYILNIGVLNSISQIDLQNNCNCKVCHISSIGQTKHVKCLYLYLIDRSTKNLTLFYMACVIYKILNIGVLNSISQMHLQNICHCEICHISSIGQT